nr:acyltransferase [Phytoactinopolyspora mesophila]
MDRDRVIDAVRVTSLLVVVVGHWLMAGVTNDGGEVRGTNTLTEIPALQPLTWVFQVMPLFFVAGGFANVTVWRRTVRRGYGYPEFLRNRTIRLLRPVLVFVLIAQSLLGAAWIAGLPADDLDYVASLLGRPLWFLVIYLLVTALAPVMAAWHARAPVMALIVPAGAAAVADVSRLAADGPAYVNFALVWLAVQQLGVWYADGHLTGMSRRALGAVLGLALATLLVLTVPGPYPVSMIGLPGETSNMNPPSVCLMLLAVAQTALIVLVRPRLLRWLGRPGTWAVVVVLGARAMQLYLWHLAALVAVVGLTLLFGVGLPAPGTVAWWLTRPVWLAVLAGVLATLVVPMFRLERFSIAWRAAGAGRRAPERRDVTHSVVVPRLLAPGVALVMAGLFGYATSGLEYFGSAGEGLAGFPVSWLPSTLCLVGGWTLTSAARRSFRGTSRR